MHDAILSLITAFTLTYFAIPSIIRIARIKNLYDEPDARRVHDKRVPTLGGVAIFAGTLFSIILWTPFNVFGDLQYVLCSFIIIFLIGAKDDIEPIDPLKKVVGQLFATAILVFKSNITLTSLYGIFGIYDLPYWPSIILSSFTIMVIINAFNLIDGINGLSGSIGTLMSLFFGTWFLINDKLEFALVAFSLAGACMAFLKYNFSPAQIFMGDTGSLLIGLIAAILAINFIELHRDLSVSTYTFKAVPAVAVSILILPPFDTLRVFVTRVLKGRSPFSADRRHIHHLLIDYGFSHMQATIILIAVNLLFILTVFLFQDLGSLKLLILMIVAAVSLTYFLHFKVRRKKANVQVNS